MSKTHKIICLLLIALQLCMLSSCSSISGLLRYILSLPMMLFNSLPV